VSNYRCRHCGKIADKEPCQHCGRHDRMEHISGPLGRVMENLRDKMGEERGEG
jgi:hypothetical protein